MNGLRILFVCHSAASGGSNQTLLSLLRHRPEHTQCTCVFMEPGPVQDQAAALGAETELIVSGRARELWKVPGVVRALREAIRSHDAEVVFAHITKAHLYASPAARAERKPYLWWQHEHRGQKPVMHALSARLPATAIICSADWTAEHHRSPGTTARVQRIHAGIETDSPPPPRRHIAGHSDPLTIGVVGRLQRWKRVELVLRALPRLLAAEPRLHLRVLGATTPGVDEGYAEELRREAHLLGIEQSVEFAGHVSDAGAEIARLDVLVHAAELEPFGLVLLEAMLAGVPVVTADEGGPREIVRNGVDGLLTAVDPASLSAAILELLQDPARRAQMGAAGRERVLRYFSARRMAEETWALVHSVRDGG